MDKIIKKPLTKYNRDDGVFVGGLTIHECANAVLDGYTSKTLNPYRSGSLKGIAWYFGNQRKKYHKRIEIHNETKIT